MEQIKIDWKIYGRAINCKFRKLPEYYKTNGAHNNPLCELLSLETRNLCNFENCPRKGKQNDC